MKELVDWKAIALRPTEGWVCPALNLIYLRYLAGPVNSTLAFNDLPIPSYLISPNWSDPVTHVKWCLYSVYQILHGYLCSVAALDVFLLRKPIHSKSVFNTIQDEILLSFCTSYTEGMSLS